MELRWARYELDILLLLAQLQCHGLAWQRPHHFEHQPGRQYGCTWTKDFAWQGNPQTHLHISRE